MKLLNILLLKIRPKNCFKIASEDLTKKLPKIAVEDSTDASSKLLLKIRQKTA